MYIKSIIYQEDLERIISESLPWDKLREKVLLITGGTGLIGTVFIDALMKWNSRTDNGVTIYSLGRNEQKAKERFCEYLNNDYFHFVKADINKSLPVDVRADYVIHAASNTHPIAYSNDPVGTIMTNIMGLHNILEYSRLSKTQRVVFLSSVEIYGKALHETDVFDEKYSGYIDCNTLRAGYPESKRTGEALCQAYIDKYNMDIVIPRLSRIFGPTMQLDDSKAIAQFIMNAVNGKDIVLKSEGNQKFSYCYAADAVAGILTVMLKGKTGVAYNIGQVDEVISLKEIARILSDIAGVSLKMENPNDDEKKGFSTAVNAILNTEKVVSLGWKTRKHIVERFKDTIDILKMNYSL